MAACRAGAEEVQGAAGEVRRGQSSSGSETETRSKPAGLGDEETLQDGSRLSLLGELNSLKLELIFRGDAV